MYHTYHNVIHNVALLCIMYHTYHHVSCGIVIVYHVSHVSSITRIKYHVDVALALLHMYHVMCHKNVSGIILTR